jgi:cellulose 1,4-beta-cellobiosidase
MDIWEANSAATALTPHPCEAEGVLVCSGDQCTSTCDPAGCDFNPYRLGAHSFYGPNQTINTNQPFTVVTQFITDTGSDNGTLTAINRLYKQNGKIIGNAQVNVTGMSSSSSSSISDSFCKAEAQAFNGGSGFAFEDRGGMKGIGGALGRGMVLAMSVWEDSGSGMQWLDGQTGDPSQPGNLRGPCSASSGQPSQIQQQYPNSAVTFANIKTGELGSTF